MTASIAHRYLQDGAGRPNEHSQNTVDELNDLINRHLTWQTKPFQQERLTTSYPQSIVPEAPRKNNVGTKLPNQNSRDGANRSQGIVDELIEMIDEHLATQLDAAQHERTTSAGTMFVDWDGTGEPMITYRNHKEGDAAADPASHNSTPFNTALALKSLPPLPSKATTRISSTVNNWNNTATDSSSQANLLKAPQPRKHLSSSRSPNPSKAPQFTDEDGLQITYRPARPSKTSGIVRPAYVAGYDPSTHYSYDYNGRIVHIHRDSVICEGGERLSMCSEYYAVDAEEYNPHVPLIVEPPAQTLSEQKKRDQVVSFVQKLLRRLDDLGIMKKLREERRKLRCRGG